jgi:hypothetical protein
MLPYIHLHVSPHFVHTFCCYTLSGLLERIEEASGKCDGRQTARRLIYPLDNTRFFFLRLNTLIYSHLNFPVTKNTLMTSADIRHEGRWFWASNFWRADKARILPIRIVALPCFTTLNMSHLNWNTTASVCGTATVRHAKVSCYFSHDSSTGWTATGEFLNIHIMTSVILRHVKGLFVYET